MEEDVRSGSDRGFFSDRILFLEVIKRAKLGTVACWQSFVEGVVTTCVKTRNHLPSESVIIVQDNPCRHRMAERHQRSCGLVCESTK